MADLNQEIEDMWLKVKEATTNVFERELTVEEFYYLTSCYPYLEICDTDYPFIDDGSKPKIIEMDNGWRIFDFKSVLVSGNSELLQRERTYPKPGRSLPPGIFLDDEEDDDDGGGGVGTIVKQYADVAEKMIALAIEREWKAAEVISGYYPMQRLAWIAAREKEYRLKGFDPTAEDFVVAGWVEKLNEKKLYTPDVKFPKLPKLD